MRSPSPLRHVAARLKAETLHGADLARSPGRHALERAGVRRGVLPDFLVIGAMKCGTTTLYDWLTDHPSVLAAVEKEVHFFDFHYARGPLWYRSQLPTQRARDNRGAGAGHALTGEASPTYLFHPLAARRARAVVPNVQSIVLLRNPVDRAYSHYQTSLRHGWDALSFEAALDREPERLDGQVDALLQDEANNRSFARYRWSYQAMGHYAEQLQDWFAHFPREQFLIIRNEDLDREPQATFTRVHDYLGLTHRPLEERARRVVGRYEPMPAVVRARLVEYFGPHNARLADLLGFDPGWDR